MGTSACPSPAWPRPMPLRDGDWRWSTPWPTPGETAVTAGARPCGSRCVRSAVHPEHARHTADLQRLAGLGARRAEAQLPALRTQRLVRPQQDIESLGVDERHSREIHDHLALTGGDRLGQGHPEPGGAGYVDLPGGDHHSGPVHADQVELLHPGPGPAGAARLLVEVLSL